MAREPELSPAEERVRRLLAEARLDEPMPDDVVARLDAVIADLATEPRSVHDVHDHDDSLARARELATARRRRTARNLLVAAAAVVAIGVGLNSVDLTVSGDHADSGATSDAGGDAAGASAAESAPSDRLNGAITDQETPSETADKPGRATHDFQAADADLTGVVRLSSARFGPQVRRIQVAQKVARDAGAGAASIEGLISLGRSPLRAGCSTHGWGEGLLVPARYNGRLGAVVFREPSGETQVVDLYLCGSDEPARSITLPAR